MLTAPSPFAPGRLALLIVAATLGALGLGLLHNVAPSYTSANNYETFSADDTFGADDVASAPTTVPSQAENDFPGKSDGFVRSVNEKGEEVRS